MRIDNAGVAAARNKGISLSEGVYICFIDSDDYICPDYLEKMYTKINDEELDCVCCGAIYESPSGVEENIINMAIALFCKRI